MSETLILRHRIGGTRAAALRDQGGQARLDLTEPMELSLIHI